MRDPSSELGSRQTLPYTLNPNLKDMARWLLDSDPVQWKNALKFNGVMVRRYSAEIYELLSKHRPTPSFKKQRGGHVCVLVNTVHWEAMGVFCLEETLVCDIYFRNSCETVIATRYGARKFA